MRTKLDRLLESIDPDEVLEETYNRANEAIGSFRYDKATVKTWEQFKCCMALFLKHLDTRILRLKKPIDAPSTEYWPRCIRPLMKIYGGNGDVTAFIIANTGNEGGLYAVLKAFAMYKAEEYSTNEIKGRIYAWWEALSLDEKLKVSEEYVAKYNHIIPSELSENGVTLIRSCFWKVLEKHPSIVQRLRLVGR